MDKVVTSFKKNSTEEVRAGIQQFQGRPYAFVRAFVENESGQWVPTKKGLTIGVDLLPELSRAVQMLVEEAVKQKLVEEERFEGEQGRCSGPGHNAMTTRDDLIGKNDFGRCDARPLIKFGPIFRAGGARWQTGSCRRETSPPWAGTASRHGK